MAVRAPMEGRKTVSAVAFRKRERSNGIFAWKSVCALKELVHNHRCLWPSHVNNERGECMDEAVFIGDREVFPNYLRRGFRE